MNQRNNHAATYRVKKKYFSFIKRMLIFMIENFVFSLIGIWIAHFVQYAITPLQPFADFCCGLGAAAGAALAFAHQFGMLKKYTGLLFYVAAVYFTSSYCYTYGKLSQMAASEIIVRAFRFSFILGILLLECRLISRYICYLRSKAKQHCTLRF